MKSNSENKMCMYDKNTISDIARAAGKNNIIMVKNKVIKKANNHRKKFCTKNITYLFDKNSPRGHKVQKIAATWQYSNTDRITSCTRKKFQSGRGPAQNFTFNTEAITLGIIH